MKKKKKERKGREPMNMIFKIDGKEVINSPMQFIPMGLPGDEKPTMIFSFEKDSRGILASIGPEDTALVQPGQVITIEIEGA